MLIDIFYSDLWHIFIARYGSLIIIHLAKPIPDVIGRSSKSSGITTTHCQLPIDCGDSTRNITGASL
jgi:hypothetical protein